MLPLRPLPRRCLAALLLALPLGCAPPAAEEHPLARNVILISIDTLRADHLGCYGYERPTSPNLDALAASGAVFEATTSTAAWTIPAHLSMLTGLYPRSHGVDGTDQALPAGIATLPELLTAHGMRTAAFVNTELMNEQRGFARGFEHFSSTPSSRAPRGSTVGMLENLQGWVAAEASPFFALLHLYDVHSDYKPLRAYRELFERPYEGKASGSTRQMRMHRLGRAGPWDETDAAHLVDLYDAGIRQLDEQLQPLFEWLESEGLLAETLIVVTSDHGEEFLEHGGVLHGRALYQELVHVPLIMRGPGIPAGARIPEDVSLVDLAPTILSLVGAQQLEDGEGQDLSAAWRERADWPPQRVVFSEADFWMDMQEGDRRSSVRKGRYKLLVDHLSGRRELYDLELDPHEQSDLAAELPAVVQALERELAGFESGSRELEAELELSEEERSELERLGYF